MKARLEAPEINDFKSIDGVTPGPGRKTRCLPLSGEWDNFGTRLRCLIVTLPIFLV